MHLHCSTAAYSHDNKFFREKSQRLMSCFQRRFYRCNENANQVLCSVNMCALSLNNDEKTKFNWHTQECMFSDILWQNSLLPSWPTCQVMLWYLLVRFSRFVPGFVSSFNAWCSCVCMLLPSCMTVYLFTFFLYLSAINVKKNKQLYSWVSWQTTSSAFGPVITAIAVPLRPNNFPLNTRITHH